jgi:AcrR family transcriptional regulator
MKEFTARQKEIIRVSGEIISESGIKALTMKKIASRIRTTDAAIYKHFKSKEEILNGLVYVFRTQTTQSLAGLNDASMTGVNRIRAFFMGRCEQFENDRGMAVVMFPHDIFKSDHRVFKSIIGTIEEHGVLLSQIIREGQDKGELRSDIPGQHIFTAVMGALRLLITRWRGANYGFSLPDEGGKLWESLEKMIIRK